MITLRSVSSSLWRRHGPFQQVRWLNLLEYHSHNLLKNYHIPVPNGFVVTSPEEAREVVSSIDAPSVLKAQILAGGRGKGKYSSDGKGGVRIVDSANEAFENASQMIGHRLTTKQTPPDGLPVNKLYIYKSVDIAQELYVALTLDRQRCTPVLLMSDDGGVNIESNVDKLQHFWFHLPVGITSEIASYIQAQFGFSDVEMAKLKHIIDRMVKLFAEKDATLLELNPLVRTSDGQFVCVDVKLNVDNCARFRQGEVFSLEEHSPEEDDEYEAAKLGLSYVRLDGDIGNIVNGAGLAMATNDLVTSYGGRCANFLDVGGSATKETVLKAFSILGHDSRIKGIFVNIYGGIVRCDMIAEAILAADAQQGGFNIPVVVRLQGTNSEKGLELLKLSGSAGLTVEPDLELAAQQIVERARSNE